MKRKSSRILVGVVSVFLVAAVAGAAELTVDSILAGQRSGAPAEGIISMVNNPANTSAFTVEDIVTLRDAGVPESVIAAVWARVPAAATASRPLEPDDDRLVGLVSLIESGMSQQIITAQVMQADGVYQLSVNDLLYLKQNGASESTIEALMATRVGSLPAAPMAESSGELVFGDLVLVKKGMFGFLKKDRSGSLVLDGDTLTWKNGRDSARNFQFQATGVDKVWFTCEARSSGNFCHQINFKIVKGDVYRFQDGGRDGGSNAAVTGVMDALRARFPRLDFGTPNIHG